MKRCKSCTGHKLKLLSYLLVNKLNFLNLPHPHGRASWIKTVHWCNQHRCITPDKFSTQWDLFHCPSGNIGCKSIFFHTITTCTLFFRFCFEDTLYRHCYDIDPQKRLDCGYYGIKERECKIDRGCCYDDTVQGVPWCFRSKIDLGNK